MLILAQHLHLLTEILHALLDLLCHISHVIHGQKITWENPEVGWRARLSQVGTYIMNTSELITHFDLVSFLKFRCVGLINELAVELDRALREPTEAPAAVQRF